MGHEGMRASLVSREISCDSVEAVMHAERLDGFVGMAGCDKSMPAMLMAAARLDLASVLVYNGSILPGEWEGGPIDVVERLRGGRRLRRGHDHRGASSARSSAAPAR